MSEMEREAYENRIAAMSLEEQKIVATKINIDILWDELRKRETEERNHLQKMKELMVNVCG